MHSPTISKKNFSKLILVMCLIFNISIAHSQLADNAKDNEILEDAYIKDFKNIKAKNPQICSMAKQLVKEFEKKLGATVYINQVKFQDPKEFESLRMELKNESCQVLSINALCKNSENKSLVLLNGVNTSLLVPVGKFCRYGKYRN